MLYLAHFARPINGRRHVLRHVSETPAERSALRGQQTYDTTIFKAANDRQIAVFIVLTFAGNGQTEREYKRRYKQCYTELCPLCNPRQVREFTSHGTQWQVRGVLQ